MTRATRYRVAQEARTRTAYKIMQSVFDLCKAQGQTPEQIDLAIRDAYPWGERRAWPYKAWLGESSTRSTACRNLSWRARDVEPSTKKSFIQ